jgi:hypothetical protein
MPLPWLAFRRLKAYEAWRACSTGLTTACLGNRPDRL